MNIFKKLKLIEEKIRKTLGNATSKVTKSGKNLSTTTENMKAKKVSIKNKTMKTTKSQVVTTTTTATRPTTTVTLDSTRDEYMMVEEFLNKELSELDLGEDYNSDANVDIAEIKKEKKVEAAINELKNSLIQNSAKNKQSEKSQSLNNAPLQIQNFKPLSNSADHEWSKALSSINDHHQDSGLNSVNNINNNNNGVPAFLPVETHNLGNNNQLAPFNAKSGAAAQKQDLNREADPSSTSNTGKMNYINLLLNL